MVTKKTGTGGNRTMLQGPIPEITDEEVLEASRALAGIAAVKNDPCGLLEVLDTLALRERLVDLKVSSKKV